MIWFRYSCSVLIRKVDGDARLQPCDAGNENGSNGRLALANRCGSKNIGRKIEEPESPRPSRRSPGGERSQL